jgi:uncharacterized protein (TIGR03086 family)
MLDMNVIADYDRAAAAATAVLSKIEPGQYGAATPCDKWTVRDVVNHLTYGNLMSAAILRGDDPPERGADYLGDDPPGAFDLSVAGAKMAMAAPGVLDKTVPTPLGEQPGSFVVHMRVNELIVHSWDLAKATGQSTDIEPELAEAALAQWKARMADVPRSEGGPFAAEQPALPGATVADQLAAFLGRVQSSS